MDLKHIKMKYYLHEKDPYPETHRIVKGDMWTSLMMTENYDRGEYLLYMAEIAGMDVKPLVDAILESMKATGGYDRKIWDDVIRSAVIDKIEEFVADFPERKREGMEMMI